jgi:hypothetical protein
MWQNRHRSASTRGLSAMSAFVNTRRVHGRTLLQRLHGLERDLELIGRVKGRGVVLDLNAEERDDRHGVWWEGWIVGRKLYWGKDADSGMWQAAGSWSGWWWRGQGLARVKRTYLFGKDRAEASLVDRGNNQHTVGLVHRVHGRFDASRDHPSRPCWTAQFMSHDDIYFVLYSVSLVHGLVDSPSSQSSQPCLKLRHIMLSLTKPHHSLGCNVIPLSPVNQPSSRHALSYVCTISRRHTPTRILRLACGGESAASMASYHAGTLRGWP